MKKFLIYIVCSFAFAGCDIIPENERIIEMEEVIPLKKVLLMDFTDQDCINCLKAEAEATMLKAYYGDNFITVSVHASARRFPLRTPEGNEYEKHFEIGQHPTGVIDGLHISSNFSQWGGLVLNRFNILPSVNIHLSIVYNSENKDLTIISNFQGLKRIENARLLLWIVEDDVVDWQRISETEVDYAYHHRHVLRAAATADIWGDSFSIQTDEERTSEHHFSMKDDWNVTNISVIAFIYHPDSNEIFDVSEISLKNNNE